MGKNKNNNLTYGYGPYQRRLNWDEEDFFSEFNIDLAYERTVEAYDFLRDYSDIHNQYRACTPQPNPFSSKVMFIISALTKMGVKYTIDIFSYDGFDLNWGLSAETSHKLVNIIAEPNPEVKGAAIVFVAHHDVANIHSNNCQDNGASVCNLLRLASLLKKDGDKSQRTLLLFSDCEEYGARGAERFAKKTVKDTDNKAIILHETFGEISEVINLELTGKGDVVWSDCEFKKPEIELHEKLEKTFGKSIPKLDTPPNDAIAFRKYFYPVLCIGILPENDMKHKDTWRVCHSLKDNLEGCNRKDMEDFTTFLFNLTKLPPINENTGANETTGDVQA